VLLLLLYLRDDFFRHHRLGRVLVHNLRVEILNIVLVRNEFCLDLARQQFLQIQSFEEFVAKDLLGVLQLSKTLLAILIQQHFYQVLRLVTHVYLMLLRVGPSERSLLDQLVHLMLVLVIERWDAYYHFVNENTECPPVECVIVTGADNHLG